MVNWDVPVTPAHAAAFITLCAALGFLSGLGMCALLAMAGWQRFREAFGI